MVAIFAFLLFSIVGSIVEVAGICQFSRDILSSFFKFAENGSFSISIVQDWGVEGSTKGGKSILK